MGVCVLENPRGELLWLWGPIAAVGLHFWRAGLLVVRTLNPKMEALENPMGWVRFLTQSLPAIKRPTFFFKKEKEKENTNFIINP